MPKRAASWVIGRLPAGAPLAPSRGSRFRLPRLAQSTSPAIDARAAGTRPRRQRAVAPMARQWTWGDLSAGRRARPALRVRRELLVRPARREPEDVGDVRRGGVLDVRAGGAELDP